MNDETTRDTIRCQLCSTTEDVWYMPHGGCIEWACWQCLDLPDAETPPVCPFIEDGEQCDLCSPVMVVDGGGKEYPREGPGGL